MADIAALGVNENTLRTLGFSYEEICDCEDNNNTETEDV